MEKIVIKDYSKRSTGEQEQQLDAPDGIDFIVQEGENGYCRYNIKFGPLGGILLHKITDGGGRALGMVTESPNAWIIK